MIVALLKVLGDSLTKRYKWNGVDIIGLMKQNFKIQVWQVFQSLVRQYPEIYLVSYASV